MLAQAQALPSQPPLRRAVAPAAAPFEAGVAPVLLAAPWLLCWTCGSTRLLLVQAAHELVAKIATQGRVAGVEPPASWVKLTLNRSLIPLSSHWPVGPGPNLIR